VIRAPSLDRRGDLAGRVALARDLLVAAMLPGLLRASLSGASLEFENRAQFFQGLANTGGSLAEQIGTLALLAMAAALAGVGKARWRDVAAAGAAVAPFLIYAVVSTAWSAHPELTIRRSMRLTIETGSALTLGLSYVGEFWRLRRTLFVVCAGVALIDVALLAAPARSFTSIGFVGAHPHKLEAGKFLLIAAPVFALEAAASPSGPTRRLAIVGLTACLALSPLTRAKTAWAAGPLAALVAYGAIWAPRGDPWLRIVAAGAFLSAGAAAATALAFALDLDVMEMTFGDSTLTGRDQIWRFVLDRARDHELLGLGYGGLWQTGPEIAQRLRDGMKIYVVNQAHNGYIDIYAQTGRIGVALAAGGLATMGWRVLSASWRLSRAKPTRLDRVGRPLADRSAARGATQDVRVEVRGGEREARHAVFYAAYLLAAALILNLTDTTFFWAYTSLWSLPVALYALAWGEGRAALMGRG
jgi:O-antigen ligase